MTGKETCGGCRYLVRDDGKPYWCCLLPMYTIRTEQDGACDDYQ